MMKIAPHLVKPLPCLMPTYGHGIKGKEAMYIALFLNDLISWDQSHGIEEERYLKRGKVLSKELCLKYLPGIKGDGLNGAALWYDAIAVNTEKLTLTFILKAVERLDPKKKGGRPGALRPGGIPHPPCLEING